MNIKLTKKAEEELLKLVSNEITKINFTDMVVGDGLYTNDELLADITALKSMRIKTKVGNVYEELVGGSSQLFITSTFYNKDIEDKFEVREVGIFAKSTDTDAEYLYAYYIVKSDDMAIAIIQDKTTPQYIPISVNSKLSSIDEAKITLVDDILVVSQEEFNRHKTEVNRHISNENNPHKVTKAQVGLDKVDNTPDISKSVNYSNSSGTSNGLWGYTGSNIGKTVDDNTYFAVMNGSQGGASGGWANTRALKNYFPLLDPTNIKNMMAGAGNTLYVPQGGSWLCLVFINTVDRISYVLSGVYSGGSYLVKLGNGEGASGFCWRIA